MEEHFEEENGILRGAWAEERADVEVVEFGVVRVGVGICGRVGGLSIASEFG